MSPDELKEIERDHVSKTSLWSLIGITSSAMALLLLFFFVDLIDTVGISLAVVNIFISILLGVTILVLFSSTVINGMAGNLKICSVEPTDGWARLAIRLKSYTEVRAAVLLVSGLTLFFFADVPEIRLIGLAGLAVSASSFLFPWLIGYLQQVGSDDNRLYGIHIKLQKFGKTLPPGLLAKEIREKKDYQKFLETDKTILDQLLIAYLQTETSLDLFTTLLLLEDANPDKDPPSHTEAAKAKAFWISERN